MGVKGEPERGQTSMLFLSSVLPKRLNERSGETPASRNFGITRD